MDFQKLTGLIPHLVVKGGAAAIDYYKTAIGAEELSRMPGPDGRLMHAALKVEGSILFLCDDFPEHCGGVSRAPKGDSPVTLHLCQVTMQGIGIVSVFDQVLSNALSIEFGATKDHPKNIRCVIHKAFQCQIFVALIHYGKLMINIFVS